MAATAGLLAGLAVNIFWNPPYPFPFENNYAMVDFVELQRAAAGYIQEHLAGKRIATAWPYTAALRRPDYGYVEQPQRVVETNDFHVASIRALAPEKYDVLAVYTRTWAPAAGVLRWQAVQSLLHRFYDYEPEISEAQCEAMGLKPVVSWERRGQTIVIYQHRIR
jgi:hypothetical protein